jgi:hypothetical protein
MSHDEKVDQSIPNFGHLEVTDTKWEEHDVKLIKSLGMIRINSISAIVGDKRPGRWFKKVDTKKLVVRLAHQYNIPIGQMYYIQNGGNNRGSWAHKILVAHFIADKCPGIKDTFMNFLADILMSQKSDAFHNLLEDMDSMTGATTSVKSMKSSEGGERHTEIITVGDVVTYESRKLIGKIQHNTMAYDKDGNMISGAVISHGVIDHDNTTEAQMGMSRLGGMMTEYHDNVEFDSCHNILLTAQRIFPAIGTASTHRELAIKTLQQHIEESNEKSQYINLLQSNCTTPSPQNTVPDMSFQLGWDINAYDEGVLERGLAPFAPYDELSVEASADIDGYLAKGFEMDVLEDKILRYWAADHRGYIGRTRPAEFSGEWVGGEFDIGGDTVYIKVDARMGHVCVSGLTGVLGISNMIQFLYSPRILLQLTKISMAADVPQEDLIWRAQDDEWYAAPIALGVLAGDLWDDVRAAVQNLYGRKKGSEPSFRPPSESVLVRDDNSGQHHIEWGVGSLNNLAAEVGGFPYQDSAAATLRLLIEEHVRLKNMVARSL